MQANIFQVVGGLGLFLLGMIVMTEGLRALAGPGLRRLLTQFTRTPLRGVAAGAAATALVQSSGAVSVMVIGFVGAGAMSFHQALGIILGANIGTTATGWIVALLGFKLNLGELVTPLVLAGVLARVMGGRRAGQVGWALAGFGVLFMGIGLLQQGMAQFEGLVTPADFPGDGALGRLELVGIGLAVTVLTQSSSVGVAAALAALGAGAISFPQAAAMVIGMNIGSTSTALMATFGGSTAARQTGYAHAIYNVSAAAVAFVALGWIGALARDWMAAGGDAQIALVAFHTAFNVIGVALVLPLSRPFARLVVRLAPERGPPLLRRLDDRLLRDPPAAVDAAAATCRDIADALVGVLRDRLTPAMRRRFDEVRLAAVGEALMETRRFVEQIRTAPADRATHQRHLSAVHALDHLNRLAERCAQEPRIEILGAEARLRRLTGVLRDAADRFLAGGPAEPVEARADRVRRLFRRQRESYRGRTVEVAAERLIDADTALLRLDGVRWLHRVAYHLWRIAHHLRLAAESAATPAPGPDPGPDPAPPAPAPGQPDAPATVPPAAIAGGEPAPGDA